MKAAVTSYLALAAGELKKSGKFKFKLGGMLNNEEAQEEAPCRCSQGCEPFRQGIMRLQGQACQQVLAMKKLKELVN